MVVLTREIYGINVYFASFRSFSAIGPICLYVSSLFGRAGTFCRGEFVLQSPKHHSESGELGFFSDSHINAECSIVLVTFSRFNTKNGAFVNPFINDNLVGIAIIYVQVS